VITTFVGRAGVRRHYGNTITLCPPLVITQAECDRIVDTLDRALGIPSAASIAIATRYFLIGPLSKSFPRHGLDSYSPMRSSI
jgi:hypothetical protein